MTALSGTNRAWIESLYAQYLESPSSVDPSWRAFFKDQQEQVRLDDVRPPAPNTRSIFGGQAAAVDSRQADHIEKNAQVLGLIQAFRRDGHLVANLDPLGLRERPELSQFTLEAHGLNERDLDTAFHVGTLPGPKMQTLRDIVARLQATYCGPLGAEYMYIRDSRRRQWLQQRIEEAGGRVDLDRPTALRVLEKLTAAEGFESFIQLKFLGKKRFSVEGGDSVIPLLDLMLSTAAGLGVNSAIIGMAHRGRLNVLANILGKAHGDIFEEFEDRFERPAGMGSGDVKYHLGYDADVELAEGRRMRLNLAFNPSHLEFVAPVVEGHVRGLQDHFKDQAHSETMAVVLHGDAAIAGQGIAFETIQLSRLPGYSNGGTIHVVINNQIGFTTPMESARSSEHCTDVVKAVLMPVLHVNADDLGAVAFAARLAAEYRQTFQEDLILDLVCFRKFGHNEADEPKFTNPLMYNAIRKRKTTLGVFCDAEVARGTLNQEDVNQASQAFREHLDAELARARDPERHKQELGGLWKGLRAGFMPPQADYRTSAPQERLRDLMLGATQLPDGFRPHRKVVRTVLEPRRRMARGEEPLNWGGAETLAYATLLAEGHPIRLSGQDCGRGTFAHRHAVVHHQETGEAYQPLAHLPQSKADFQVYDSPLSEAAVLGFEFGYSLARPDALVIWEAQFGDFANGAQVIIDQFVSSSEAKWNLSCGLVMLLPHGYEGQGPEHSSARLERFLALSGEDNWRVVNLTTPAQVFHALRSQVKRSYRKPLVVMSPKSLLRHPEAKSQIEELVSGHFRPVIGDPSVPADEVRKVVLCSGKVYYDLLQARESRGERRVALVRVEQLYPLDEASLLEAVGAFPDDAELVWCQEEPFNMGAWLCLLPELMRVFGRAPVYAGRARAAAPATGSPTIHDAEQTRLIAEALNIES